VSLYIEQEAKTDYVTDLRSFLHFLQKSAAMLYQNRPFLNSQFTVN